MRRISKDLLKERHEDDSSLAGGRFCCGASDSEQEPLTRVSVIELETIIRVCIGTEATLSEPEQMLGDANVSDS